MTDVMNAMSLSDPTEQLAGAIASLWSRLPLPEGQAVVVLLPFNSPAYAAVAGAAAIGRWPLVSMPVDAQPQGLAHAIAQHRPGVVVCMPEIFGWASKQAFLGHCSAIYTCGEEGEGTLLDRARHCAEPLSAPLNPLDQVHCVLLDAQGQPL